MKKSFRVLAGLSLSIAIAVSSFGVMASPLYYASSGAAEDKSYTLEEMLTYAMQDEYMAEAEYDAVMDAYGVQKPFSNIIKAEATHINLLLPLFKTYHYAVPINDAETRIVLPSSLAESYQTGVDAEIKNIAMYEKFLKEGLPDDIHAIFERLKEASEKHLAAFERAVEGGSGNRNSNGGRKGKI